MRTGTASRAATLCGRGYNPTYFYSGCDHTLCIPGTHGQILDGIEAEGLDCALSVGSELSAAAESWWIHLVHSGIEQICRPRADDLLHGSHGAEEADRLTCSGSTWYTPGGLISQAARGMVYEWHVHVHGVHGVCMVCAWCVRDIRMVHARWPTLTLLDVHARTHAHAPARPHTPQVVTLTLLDIVFLVLNELLWGLLWTVVSRLFGRRSYAQSSINAYYDPPEFLFADRYAYMLKIAAMVLVFAPAVPLPY